MIIISGATILFGFLAWALLSGIAHAIVELIDKIEGHFERKHK